MQNEKPDIHIIGHWSYLGHPARRLQDGEDDRRGRQQRGQRGAVCQRRLQGQAHDNPIAVTCTPSPTLRSSREPSRPSDTRATAAVATYELTTAGPPAAIKLTLHTAPGGVRADGEDIALIDVEVVDAKGVRCPTDDARIDFNWSSVGRTVSATGPAVWRGGYNSGKINSTNNLYLNTEDGINRVAMRSTLMPVNYPADRHACAGLQPATASFDTKPVTITDGLSAGGTGNPVAGRGEVIHALRRNAEPCAAGLLVGQGFGPALAPHRCAAFKTTLCSDSQKNGPGPGLA